MCLSPIFLPDVTQSSPNLGFSVDCSASRPSPSFWSKGVTQRAVCRDSRAIASHPHGAPIPPAPGAEETDSPLYLTMAQTLLPMVLGRQRYWGYVKTRGRGEKTNKRVIIKTSFFFKSSHKVLGRAIRSSHYAKLSLREEWSSPWSQLCGYFIFWNICSPPFFGGRKFIEMKKKAII